LIAGSGTGRIGVWSIPDLFTSTEPDRVYAIHSLGITDLAVSSGMRIFSVSSDKTAKCFDFCAGCEILGLNFPASLTCCALLNNESALYCGGNDGQIYQVELCQETGIQKVLSGHSMEITDLRVSYDDRVLFSCSLDGTVRRWDTATGQTINQIQVRGAPFALTFLPSSENAAPPEDELQKKGRRARAQDSRKGFPHLAKAIRGNREEFVSAPVEDIPILSLDDEAAIAIADLCDQQPMADVEPPHEATPETDEARDLKTLFFQ
jgi:hypothetical protein